jgi:mRNA-degrading endonuclease RelE of RelBE toxin-antitoxin system
MSYEIEFHPDWDGYFSKLDNGVKQRVMKKILQLQGDTLSRHLKQGLPFYVSEIGQHRLCYSVDEKKKMKTLHFVGDHKDYEKWLGL